MTELCICMYVTDISIQTWMVTEEKQVLLFEFLKLVIGSLSLATWWRLFAKLCSD